MPDFAAPALPAGSLAHQPQPVLGHNEFRLRPWQREDVPTVVTAYADSAIQQWHVRSMTTGEAGEWVASWRPRWEGESGASWAIEADGVVVGQIGLRCVRLGEGVTSLSYWVIPEGRGRGTAPRALALITGWAFEEVGLHRLELRHSTRNAPSCRVAMKAGYLVEGTERSSGLHADGWHDMHVHARVAEG